MGRGLRRSLRRSRHLRLSSQTSTGPGGKKAREILDALEEGTEIHLWARRRKTDVAFVYLGLVAPVSHHGRRPPWASTGGRSRPSGSRLGHAVLFVTLTKSESMAWGADYVGHFEGRDT
ncbi:MAG: hypothetical protein M3N47_15105, partial [Chloroflexota bacterium]|nr:hypothetical protein [Chloroflexota bacterium]